LAQDSSEVILLRSAISALEKDSLNLSIVYFNEYISLVDNNPEAFFKRGLAYFYLGRYFEATDDVNQAIILDSNYSEAYNIKGLINKRMKNINQAYKDYSKAIQLNPDYYLLNLCIR